MVEWQLTIWCITKRKEQAMFNKVRVIHVVVNSVEEAAKASAPESLRPDLRVTTGAGSDASGAYKSVTVNYTFKTLTRYPMLPRTVEVSRTSMLRATPNTPR